jgi:hypothetical protein
MRSSPAWTLGLLLCLEAAGCIVHAGPAPGVVVDWRYYPAYDVYWSSAYGWSYWDGGTWVVVRTRPTWIVIAPGSRWVPVRAGPRPHVHWEQHRTYRTAPRSAPHAHLAPRGHH